MKFNLQWLLYYIVTTIKETKSNLILKKIIDCFIISSVFVYLYQHSTAQYDQ